MPRDDRPQRAAVYASDRSKLRETDPIVVMDVGWQEVHTDSTLDGHTAIRPGPMTVVRGEEPAMHDMLPYLDHRFSSTGEVRLVIAATRHEDDGASAGPQSLEYHRQRGRLLKSLIGAEGIGRVEFSDDIDAPYACETGYALVDVPVAVAAFGGSIATMVSLWLSQRPRKKRDSVPGVRLELPGKTLIISGEVTKKERQRLIGALLNSDPGKPAKRAAARPGLRRH